MKVMKLWSVIVLMAGLWISAVANAGELPDFTSLVANNSPAIVNIRTINKTEKEKSFHDKPSRFSVPDAPPGMNEFLKKFFQGPRMPEPRETEALGSGFIISSDGYILTNYHVIKNAKEIIVRFTDRTEKDAKVIGRDKRSDVALLKVDAKGLKTVKLGNSDDLKVGQWVLAIGSPFGFDYSATQGIVSALGRSLPDDSYVPFIQTDVPINPGNSGGPLFNLQGEVVGINSQIYSRTGGYMGLSFAIPINTVMNVVKQLKEKGHVSRGWLGVVIQNVNRDLAESFGLDKPRGALVSRVVDNSPASKAKFKVGDVILEFNGKKVGLSSSLPPIVGTTEIGKTVDVVVMRDGKRKTLQVKIEELPKRADKLFDEGSNATPDQGSYYSDRLGLGVTALTQQDKDTFGVDKGVKVKKVETGPALDAGLRPGDVITRLNHVELKDPEQFMSVAKKLPEDKAISVLVQGRHGASFLALKIKKDKK